MDSKTKGLTELLASISGATSVFVCSVTKISSHYCVFGCLAEFACLACIVVLVDDVVVAVGCGLPPCSVASSARQRLTSDGHVTTLYFTGTF